jgi:hypothetical protein
LLYLEDSNLLSIHNEVAAVAGDFSLEAAVGGVILEHVDHVVQGNEGIVDSNDLGSIHECGAQHQAANAAKSVNSNLGHIEFGELQLSTASRKC